MSFVIINGREVEVLEPEKEELYPEFFEPKPVSPKKFYADNSGNIHINFQEKTYKKPVIKRRPGPIIEPVSILGKRKLVQAFGEEIYNDRDRYGQDIPADFFDTNVGHGVF
jgi:hypothetical protein